MSEDRISALLLTLGSRVSFPSLPLWGRDLNLNQIIVGLWLSSYITCKLSRCPSANPQGSATLEFSAQLFPIPPQQRIKVLKEMVRYHFPLFNQYICSIRVAISPQPLFICSVYEMHQVMVN